MSDTDFIELSRFLLKEYDRIASQIADLDDKLLDARHKNDEQLLDELLVKRYKLRCVLFYYDEMQKRLFDLLSYLLQIS